MIKEIWFFFVTHTLFTLMHQIDKKMITVNKCKYCNVEFHAQGDFCSEPCEHDWFEARLKRRVSAYKGHWTCVLETDFRGIFCKQAEKHKIRIPTSQLASEITQAFIKVINVATTEELKEMNYNLDEYQLCKKHERW